MRLSPRAAYLLLAGGTITAGLTVHWYGDALPPGPRDIAGDTLWAAMIVWLLGAALPALALALRAALAILISYGVEISQRFDSPALEAVRATTLGQLMIGTDFDARDLAAYAAGVCAAVALEWAVRRRRTIYTGTR